ncbi:MAG: DNA repair protein RecN [Bacteroidales bacterium]|nr:DNA repair protein RecN [Bacteroidales bacterium]
MLCSLRVSNYVLIGSLETSFPEGLSIISGETGAGKSILLGALSLALGGKGDASMVGAAGDNCVVEAEFSVTDAVREFLQKEDLPCDGETLILRRVLSRAGRTRSFLDDEPVSASILQELAGLLIDIHSQHQTLKLQDDKFRLEALDLYAGASDACSQCASLWGAMQEASRQLADVQARLDRARREEDWNRSLLEKLQEAKLVAGELEELELEQKRLAHAEELMEMLSSADMLLSQEDSSPALRLREAQKLLEKSARYIGTMEGLAQRLEEARLEVEDIAADVATEASRLDVSPSRLQQVDDRLSLLYSLMKKHGVASVEELIAERDRLAGLVEDASSLEEAVNSASAALKKAAAAYKEASAGLHALRAAAAEPFAASIEELLHGLDLDHAAFKVALDAAPDGPFGADRVEFLFSSTGKELRDVAKAASGGELSRIMLSLKACMANYRKMPTLVFDEIDSGVSGGTADKMGSLVCSMGRKMQVFAITHLPQVAAKGNAHFLVSRKNDVTSMHLLDADGRVMEIARMLSGSTVTAAAIENAKSLLA